MVDERVVVNEREAESTLEENEPQEGLHPITDACRSLVMGKVRELEAFPPGIEEELQVLQDLEEESLGDALGGAFTFLIKHGVDDPEAVLIKEGILEETEINSES